MKGMVLNFDSVNKTGVISADDGARFTFSFNDWKSPNMPVTGVRIDFVGTGGVAQEIYLDVANQGVAASSTNSKKLTAALLAFFLGAFGAHKFYLGYTTQGFIMLAVFLLGFILLAIPSFVIGVIAFIEFIIYLTKSDAEFEKTYVIGRRTWF